MLELNSIVVVVVVVVSYSVFPVASLLHRPMCTHDRSQFRKGCILKVCSRTQMYATFFKKGSF